MTAGGGLLLAVVAVRQEGMQHQSWLGPSRTSSPKRESSMLCVASSTRRQALAEARRRWREVVLRLWDRAMVVDGCVWVVVCGVWGEVSDSKTFP